MPARPTCFAWMLLLLFIPGSLFGFETGDTASFKGEVSYSLKEDTVTVHFRVIPYKFDADEVVLRIDSKLLTDSVVLNVEEYNDSLQYVTIYQRSDTIPFQNSWRKVQRYGSLVVISGNIPVPRKGMDPRNWTVSFSGEHRTGDSSIQRIYDFTELRDWHFGLGAELIIPSYGYFKSNMAAPFDKEGPFMAWGLSAEAGVARWRFMLSTSWSGFGKNFSLAEPVRLAARFYTGTRENFLPQFYAAAKQSELKLKRDDFEYVENPWGGEFGLGFEGPFERLGYSYSTALGGYHTVELFISAISARPLRFGTRFQFIKYDDLWAVKVAINIEGWHFGYDHYLDMMRYNNRPWPHRVLAYAGMAPYLIVALPYSLITGKPVFKKPG